MARGKFGQAQRVLQDLHKTPGEVDNRLALSEYSQIREQLELENTESRTVLSGFKEPSMRKRLVLAILTPLVNIPILYPINVATKYLLRALLQCSGVLVIITYQASLYPTSVDEISCL